MNTQAPLLSQNHITLTKELIALDDQGIKNAAPIIEGFLKADYAYGQYNRYAALVVEWYRDFKTNLILLPETLFREPKRETLLNKMGYIWYEEGQILDTYHDHAQKLKAEGHQDLAHQFSENLTMILRINQAFENLIKNDQEEYIETILDKANETGVVLEMAFGQYNKNRKKDISYNFR